MTSFGTIKTKIERLFETTYGKPEFKTHMKSFKNMVLENKNMGEIYFIYKISKIYFCDIRKKHTIS